MAEDRTDDQLPPFSDEAHRVLARARAAAHRLRHATLGTEHLLIGCVEEAHGQAAELLYRAGITSAIVVKGVNLLGTPRTDVPPPELLVSPALRAALRTARVEARRLRDEQARSEHLLLAIFRERTGGGIVVLRACGLDTRAMQTAITRGRLGTPADNVRVPWIARGPYGALALLACAAILAAVAYMARWYMTVRPVVRSAYLYELLIPVALLSIGLVGLGASRIEAARQLADREMLLATWAARGAAAQIASAWSLAQSGAVEPAAKLIETAVSRAMPDSDIRAALPVLARWLAADELAPYGYFARGLLRLHADQLPAGLADLETATRMRPDDIQWQGQYGNWLAAAGRDDDALPLLRNAVTMAADEPHTTLALARLLLRRGEVPDAEALAQSAAERWPAAPRALTVIAAARYLGGATQAAQDVLAEAPSTEPLEPLAAAVRAAISLRQQQPDDALRTIRDAAAATVERPACLAVLEGWALGALGRAQEATLAYADARECDPSLPVVLKRMHDGLLRNHLTQSADEIATLLEHLEAHGRATSD